MMPGCRSIDCNGCTILGQVADILVEEAVRWGSVPGQGEGGCRSKEYMEMFTFHSVLL